MEGEPRRSLIQDGSGIPVSRGLQGVLPISIGDDTRGFTTTFAGVCCLDHSGVDRSRRISRTPSTNVEIAHIARRRNVAPIDANDQRLRQFFSRVVGGLALPFARGPYRAVHFLNDQLVQCIGIFLLTSGSAGVKERYRKDHSKRNGPSPVPQVRFVCQNNPHRSAPPRSQKLKLHCLPICAKCLLLAHHVSSLRRIYLDARRCRPAPHRRRQPRARNHVILGRTQSFLSRWGSGAWVSGPPAALLHSPAPRIRL